MSSRPWYKRFPSDFIAGTMQMSLEQKGAYSIVLDLLYDRRAPIPDDSQWIARVCGCSTRKWNQIRDYLISEGKLVSKNGCLDNPRSTKQRLNEEKEAEKLAENAAKSQDKRRENKALSNKNNNLEEKGHLQSRSQKPEARKEEEAPDYSPVRKWLVAGNENAGALFRAPLADFDHKTLLDGLDRAKRDNPPLGKRVAFLVSACRQVTALGHTGRPEGKEEFTKLKVDARIREIGKITDWNSALKVQEAYGRGEEWAKNIIWQKA